MFVWLICLVVHALCFCVMCMVCVYDIRLCIVERGQDKKHKKGRRWGRRNVVPCVNRGIRG